MAPQTKEPAGSAAPSTHAPPKDPLERIAAWLWALPLTMKLAVGFGFWALMYSAVGCWGEWIELANGATWPAALTVHAQTDSWLRAGFAFVLSLRTLINVAGPLLVIGGTIWYLTTGRKKLMEKTIANVQAVRAAGYDLALTAWLKKHEGEQIDAALVKDFQGYLAELADSQTMKRFDHQVIEATVSRH